MDRLMETGSRGASGGVGVGYRELRKAVARDLEWLLNTRVLVPDLWEKLGEARSSILTYGLPDLSPYSWASHGDKGAITARIEEVIRSFEPRLVARTVKVEILPSKSVDDFKVRLRIDALLHVEPFSERVSFDTDVDFDSGSVRVSDAS